MPALGNEPQPPRIAHSSLSAQFTLVQVTPLQFFI